MLDQLLNRVSMYRLLSIALTSLWVVAICLALFDLLPYSPVAIIASATVLVLAAYGSNILFGWLFNVKTHDESSYITAFILFFLFSPTVTVTGLVTLVLVAIIAMASKYVLAVRGRHIFNPAAISTVIIGLLGIAYATWWVATPVLLPASLLFAFLILYKTRRLQLGLVFLSTATALIIATSVMNGQQILPTIALLPSWPLIFFVGFMLSEPLTLPPREWQRYLVGIIVGILFAIPIDIGISSSALALALVIGNAIGFLFTQRRRLELVFKKRNQLSITNEEYVFEVKQPVNYIPGQYMEITIPHKHKDGRGLRRIFSIVGTPGESTVRFGTKMHDQPSSFKKALHNLPVNAVIAATGIGGDFVLPKQSDMPILFIAGGIGITPFVSHLLYLQKQKEKRDIVLIYSVSSAEDLAYADVIKSSGIRTIIATKGDDSLPDSDWIHHNAQRMTAGDILNYVPDISSRSVYISGPPGMVNDTKRIVKHFNAKHVTCDYFTGY